jgi:hypothetical protein
MYVKSSKELYGWDRLSKVTLILGICLIITWYALILGAALIVYSIWRSRSTNLHGRNVEKFVFENIERRFYHKITNLKQDLKKSVELINNKIKKYNPIVKLKENRKYIITNCPKCKQKLRLPRKKGKIIVTCSNCFSEFRLKT